jgi:hypothetical protein
MVLVSLLLVRLMLAACGGQSRKGPSGTASPQACLPLKSRQGGPCTPSVDAKGGNPIDTSASLHASAYIVRRGIQEKVYEAIIAWKKGLTSPNSYKDLLEKLIRV